MIYLDSAATSYYKPPQVADAVAEAIRNSGNPARGAHEISLGASRIVFDTRRLIAGLFNCPKADHVAFTSNVTESLNIAIYGLLGPGEHAVTTCMEHNSVLRPLFDLQDKGLELDIAGTDSSGALDYDSLEKLVRSDTKAVICTHASNLTGNTVDIKRVSETAHGKGALLIVDAAQTAGIVPIDMQEMGIDVLCFTGHKSLMGPQGTGGLCIMPGTEIRPFKKGGSGVHSYDRHQPEAYPVRLEAGTLNSHGLAGLNAAVRYIVSEGVEKLYQQEHALMMQFYEAVKAIDGVRVYGDFSLPWHAGIVSLNIRDYDSAQVADTLSYDYGIAVRAGAHCAPLMHRALGTELQGAVRFSFSPFNTEPDIQTAAGAVMDIAAL